MKYKKQIRTLAYSSIFASIITVLIIIGGIFDTFDLTCAAISSLIIQIIYTEMRKKNTFLIYSVVAVLSFILIPICSSALYFTAFFGYYPILRAFLKNKIKFKIFVYAILCSIYNLIMIVLYILFKKIFGLQDEPFYMYISLLLAANVFFFCFELLVDRIMIIYIYKLKKIFKF